MKFANRKNEDLYRLMLQIADLLQLQDADPFRISAFQKAAEQIAVLPFDLKKMARTKDAQALIALPTIGQTIANMIIEFSIRGTSSYLNRLQGEVSLEHLLDQIPGIGPTLSQRILRNIHASSLEELEVALKRGKLNHIPGFGEARLRLLSLALADLLRKKTSYEETKTKSLNEERPSAGFLLELDAQYRRLVRENKLKKIAPKRFNPTHKAWLPIFHTQRSGWQFTLLFSNTALAHQLNRHKDWVIIYYHNRDMEGQATIVTETRGKLKGKRVVRGREDECQKYYALAALVTADI